MIFPESVRTDITSQWRQLMHLKSRAQSAVSWCGDWNGCIKNLEDKYMVAVEIDNSDSWKGVLTAGRELREKMRSSGKDPYYLPRYYVKLTELTDCIDAALAEAGRAPACLPAGDQEEALLNEAGKAGAWGDKDKSRRFAVQALKEKLAEVLSRLALSRQTLIKVDILNLNVNVDFNPVITLIRNALDALKRAVDLLNDSRFTALKPPWRGDDVSGSDSRSDAGRYALSFLVSDGAGYQKELRVPGGGISFRDCWEDHGERFSGPEMVVIPAGRFMMGSPEKEEGRKQAEGPRRQVTFSRAFAVGKYAVTFEEWDAAMASGGLNGDRPDDNGWGRGRRPVIGVSWNDAQAYVKWLSWKTRQIYRLLSEAEWEYAARSGTDAPFWWGETISSSQANYYGGGSYGDSPRGEDRQETVPVDMFEPNPWGLYQIHGNVWEWVQEGWRENYQGAPSDGSVWRNGNKSLRVARGGSWSSSPRLLRAAARSWHRPEHRYNGLGFRVARTL